MAKTLSNSISIEKFAAYLDGNLSMEDTQEMSDLIMTDSSLSEILNVNTIIDNQIQQMSKQGFELPNEVATTDFAYPHFNDMAEVLSIDGNETIIAHDDNPLETKDGLGDSSNIHSFNHQDFGSHHEIINLEDHSFITNHPSDGTESNLEILNND